MAGIKGALLAAALFTGTATQGLAEGEGDYLAGSAAFDNGDYSEAYERFNALVGTAPEASYIYDMAVLSALAEGQIEDAGKFAIAMDENGSVSFYGRIALIAEAYLKGEVDLAQAHASRFPEPRNQFEYVAAERLAGAQSIEETAHQFYAFATYLEGAEAVAFARAATALAPDHTDALILNALFEIDSQNFEESLTFIDRALATDPENTLDIELMKAEVLTFAERHEDAKKIFDELYKDADVTEWMRIAEVHAGMYERQQDHEASIRIYTKILDRFGGVGNIEHYLSNTLYSRAIHYYNTDQLEQAEKDLRQAVGLFPENGDALNLLGYMLVEQGRELTEALEMIETAVDLTDGAAYVVDSLGWALYKLERYDEAVDAMEYAVEMEPTNPEITFHYAEVLAAAGRTREAGWEWNKAITMVETYYSDEPYFESIVAQAQERLENGQQIVAPAPVR